MTYGKMMSQYQKTNVETASNIDLVIMCYEKCIQYLNQAKLHYEQKQYEQKAKKLQKAMDIICILQGGLDQEKGGQIAKNLDALYTYLNKRLLQGDLKRDLTCFDETIRIMDELRGAWEGIGSQSINGTAATLESIPAKASAAGLAT